MPDPTPEQKRASKDYAHDLERCEPSPSGKEQLRCRRCGVVRHGATYGCYDACWVRVEEYRARIAELEADCRCASRAAARLEAKLAAVRKVRERCARWVTPDDLGAQFAHGRMGAFKDAARWLDEALGGGDG